jgi:hypothetical protein
MERIGFARRSAPVTQKLPRSLSRLIEQAQPACKGREGMNKEAAFHLRKVLHRADVPESAQQRTAGFQRIAIVAAIGVGELIKDAAIYIGGVACVLGALLGMGFVLEHGGSDVARAVKDRLFPHEPTVVIDSWWSGDMAEQQCETRMMLFDAEQNPRCRVARGLPGGAKDEARQFEAHLMSRMAMTPACKGVQVVSYIGPQSQLPDALLTSSQRWQLMIDYAVGARTQAWGLVRGTMVHQSEGDVVQMAADICMLVLGRGATVQ